MPDLKLGDVIAIPADGRHYLCKVIWISARTKDVIGVVAVGDPVASLDGVVPSDGPYRSFTIMGSPATVLYGDKKNVTKRGLWPIVGHLPMNEADHALATHRVGNSLYQGDDFLRNVSGEEAEHYPEMLVAGNAAAELLLKTSSLTG